MKLHRNRREFLSEVGQGMLVATVGLGLSQDLGLSGPVSDGPDLLSFGSLEPLVCLMQETPAAQLLPKLVTKLKGGTELRRLVAAGALANARTFGGEDYVGFHTLMALGPSYHMSREVPAERQALPVLKVLYRNTARIQEKGGRKDEVLKAVKGVAQSDAAVGSLREAVLGKNMDLAEKIFATMASQSPQAGFDGLLTAMHDVPEVHRVVFPYRAWDLVGIIGEEQAHTMLRQSVRYCVKSESYKNPPDWDVPRTLLPKLLEEHKLLGRAVGTRQAEDGWVDQLSQTIFSSTPVQAASAAAAALAEGFALSCIGEAITLAANQLVLRDQGRSVGEESKGKPVGSVHGDSIGVHASDSANAWRNMARVGNARNSFACLILGAYQVPLDRGARGGDFLSWKALPLATHDRSLMETEPRALLDVAEEAIRGNLQGRTTAAIARYAETGGDPRAMFALLLRYAISEDGSLHAEKYYRTASEEFHATRAAFRWRHLISLGRVTASEYGRPAAGVEEARGLLGLKV